MIGTLTKQLTRRRLSWATIIAVGVTGLFILTFPLLFNRPFPQHVMILIFLFATLGQAWNLVGGYAGQVSFGHAVFFGMGAYTSTVLLLRWNVNPWLGMLAGAVVAALVSIIIGYPCFRLKGRYFAIATMATGEIVRLMFVNWEWVGGARGLFVPMLDESLLNLQFHTTKVPYYYIALVMLVVSVLVTRRVERTRPGYYFMAINEDTDAARSLGVDATRYKLLAIIISAILSAVGGTLYAQYVLYIDPDSVLLLHLSTRICLVSVLGGTGTLWGPIIGAFILIPMAEFTRVYLGGGGRGIHLVAYGALIMLVAVIEPGGLMALIKRFRRRRAQSAASEKGILPTPA